MSKFWKTIQIQIKNFSSQSMEYPREIKWDYQTSFSNQIILKLNHSKSKIEIDYVSFTIYPVLDTEDIIKS